MHARLLHRLLAAGALSALGSTALALTDAAAQTPAPPQVSVTGVAYTQFVYQMKDTAAHVNGFDVTRAYINVIGRFSGGVSTRVTADIYRQAGDGSLRYRLKYAYFGYTPQGSPLTFKLGQIHTPFIDWEEALWDYRVQGTMALERGGYVTSSDFGAGVDFKQGPDKVNAQVTIVNGEGYGGGAGDFRKDAEARVSARVMDTDDSSRVGGLRVTGYGQIGKYTGGGDRNRYLGMVSYRSKQLTLAGEFAATKDVAITGRVISGFGVYRLPNSKIAVIARVDLTDPNTSVANNTQTRIIGGVSYQVSGNLRLLADLDRVSFEAGTTAHSLGLFQAQISF